MIRYLSLAEYLWLAEQVTGIEAAVHSKAARIDLADSALHAPSASFGGEEFYPEVIDKGCRAHLQARVEPPPPRWEQACCMGRTRHLPRSQRDHLVAGSA